MSETNDEPAAEPAAEKKPKKTGLSIQPPKLSIKNFRPDLDNAIFELTGKRAKDGRTHRP